MIKNTKGLGKTIFMEWLIPIVDYFSSLRKNEINFEIFIPILVGVFSACLYGYLGKIKIALDALAELLPSAVSILIGFTVMYITLLLTSDAPAIDRLRDDISSPVIGLIAYEPVKTPVTLRSIIRSRSVLFFVRSR